MRYNLNIFISTLITSTWAFFLQNSTAKVRIELQTLSQSLVSPLSLFEPNEDINLVFKCLAGYPVEWVFEKTNNEKEGYEQYFEEAHYRYEATTVLINPTIYIAELTFGFAGLIKEEILICRSVLNHSDSVLMQLRPIRTGTKIEIRDSNSAKDLKELLQSKIIEQEAVKTKGPCIVQFTIAKGLRFNNYLWRCSSKDDTEVGKIRFFECPNSASCANSYRNLKGLPVCVINSPSSNLDTSNPGWSSLFAGSFYGYSGVAVSTVEGRIRAKVALEYFFITYTRDLFTKGEGELHLSLHEVEPKDRVWVYPEVSDIYYTTEKLEAECRFLKYGFASNPAMIITLNESTIFQRAGSNTTELVENEGNWIRNVSINFGTSGAGVYEIQCIAWEWNSTAWINKTKAFEVRGVIAPYFQLESETVIVTNQNELGNIQLFCDALGDPKPFCNCERPTEALNIDGPNLTYSPLRNKLKCTARNRFNQTAVKLFNVQLSNNGSSYAETTELGKAAVIGILIGLIICLLLIFGSLYLYKKVVKLRTQVEVLTKEEVKEFREGKPTAPSNTILTPDDIDNQIREAPLNLEELHPTQRGHDAVVDEGIGASIESTPYNDGFDLPRESIVVDFNIELGSGQFGVVYKGSVKPNGRSPRSIPIAVKTVRKSVDITYFKALMAELKILAYIGRHDHIANLICAWTDDIEKRELFVGIELCKTSLLKYLQQHQSTFQNLVSDGVLEAETSLGIQDCDVEFTTFTLIKWAGQIAAGMEFLAAKKVVHADLAARNILLSFDSQAKICDFGLARQLVNYTYIKSEKCPLPWAWMSLESLTDMKFSTMSDVWSYGVVLFELFSIGKRPFVGYTWNAEFIEQLTAGLRMKSPLYATKHIYEVMKVCWHETPKKRPKFGELKEYFQKLERN